MGIRPSSTASSEEEEYCFVFVSCLYTARLTRIVRLVRLSEAAKGQELLASPVSLRPSRIVRLASSVLHCPSLIVSGLFCLQHYG